MKLLGSTKNKITKDKNRENVPHLEIYYLLFFAATQGHYIFYISVLYFINYILKGNNEF